MSRTVVNFSLPASSGIATEGSGHMWFENDALMIEYQLQDGILGLLKSKIQRLKLPLAHLTEIKFTPGFLHSKLTIRTDSLDFFRKIQNASGKIWEVDIRQSEKKKAADFAGEMMQRIANIQHK
jgi:antitoxin component YwqK of YwqJK toxin-antitoxin module